MLVLILIKGWKNLEEQVLIANSRDNIEILEAKQAELRKTSR